MCHGGSLGAVGHSQLRDDAEDVHTAVLERHCKFLCHLVIAALNGDECQHFALPLREGLAATECPAGSNTKASPRPRPSS